MASNATTKNGQDQSSTTIKSKKKAARKTSTSALGKKPAARKSSVKPARAVARNAFAEILFDTQPNPYHPPAPPYVWIDHPVQHETLYVPHYVIRLGVGGAEHVELSLDGKPWEPCRATSGYWWYDWSDITPGTHTLVARIKTAEQKWYRTPERVCLFQV